MEIVKKNLLSIIFGVIALLAIISLFWPIGGLYDQLQLSLVSSKAIGTNLDRIASETRTQPITDVKETEAKPLKPFPTQQIIDSGERAVQQLSDQAVKMMKAAVDANRHLPLIPRSLPNPNPSQLYLFSQIYSNRTSVDGPWMQFEHTLNAGVAPTEEEIKTANEQLHEKIMRERSAPGEQSMSSEGEREYNGLAAKTRGQMAERAAANCSVYLEDGALPIDPTIVVGGNQPLPTVDHIWNAQLGLWIIGDAVNAIAHINQTYSDPDADGKPGADVMHSVIKRIEKIDGPEVIPPVNAADEATGITTAVAFSPTVSMTGHASNGMFDVVHFSLLLDVDAAKVPLVLAEIQRNQFITVLNVQMSGVDLATEGANGFIYGTKPVARIQIDCEELLLHAWLNDLEPDSVKAAISAVSGQGGQRGPGGGSGPHMPMYGPGQRPSYGPGGPQFIPGGFRPRQR